MADTIERINSTSKHEIETISNVDEPMTEEEKALEKRTMRKVDWRVLPILGALYSISLIGEFCS